MTIQTRQPAQPAPVTPMVTFVGVVMGAVVVVVLIGWAWSFMKRVAKGEEVEYPFPTTPVKM